MDSTMLMFIFFILFSVVFSQTDLSASQTNPRIYYMHIKSDIKFRFATTLVTSKVANSAKTPVEAHFQVTLPDAAFITAFAMEIDGKIFPGEVNEKAKAKEKYDKAKKKGQSAGHVAQKPRHTNRFSVDVNIAAQSKVTFNLTYQELLERVYGEYEHIIYVDPGQIVEDFQIDVAILENKKLTKVSVPPLRNDVISDRSIEEGKNALAVVEQPTELSATVHYSPTIEDQRRASEQGLSGLFVVEYDLERELSPGEILVVDGYFVHFFAPEGMDPIKKNVLFILDVSSSMSGSKIRQQSDAIDKILQDLHEGDNFNIMEFSSKAKLWKSTLVSATPNNIKLAREYASRIRASGWTDINTAMLKGIDFLNKNNGDNRMKVMVFLTDGQASKGEQNRERILRNIDYKNTKDVAVFSLAFGSDADYEFVKKVAIKNKGVARKIFADSDAALQIKGFYDEISSAALRNVTFKYLDNNNDIASNATKQKFDTYFNGKELIIAGKLSDDDVQVLNLVVTGDGIGGQIELELESNIKSRVPELTKAGDFTKITERIWAYLTIKQLLEEAIGENNAETKKQLNDKALELSLKYKFVTPLTSMVVTKPEDKDIGAFDENEDAGLALADKQSARRSQGSSGGSGPVRSISGGSGHSRGGGGSRGRVPLRRVSGGSGHSRGGGGGGDPHFMLRIDGVVFPVCFDIPAKEGDVLRMLSDRISGMTINSEIIKSFIKRENGEYKTFIGKIVILAPRIRIEITPEKVVLNGEKFSWNDEHMFRMFGLKFGVGVVGQKDRVLKIDFENDISMQIKRTEKDGINTDVNYLNIYLDKEAGLSKEAGGILGQFVHKKTTLTKTIMDSRGRMKAHFREVENKNKTHFSAVLHSKPDVITGEMVPCWNLHNKIKGLIDGNIEGYFKSDVNTV